MTQRVDVGQEREVTFTLKGRHKNAALFIGKRKAICFNLDDLCPQAGEKWLTEVVFQNTKIIILRPIRKMEDVSVIDTESNQEK